MIPPLLLVAALLGAGCVDNPIEVQDCYRASEDLLEAPVPATLPPGTNGTGRFTLEPEPLVLTPGDELSLRLSFYNPDCHDFVYPQFVLDCTPPILTIGNGTIRLLAGPGWDGVGLAPLFQHSCGAGLSAQYQVIRPGEGYDQTIRWNGSLRFWDHARVEEGGPWVQRDVWLAPGSWNVTYGFHGRTSYPVQRSTNLTVLENAHNRDTNLSAACRRLPGSTPVEVELGANRTTARLGTNITLFANYTIHLDAPGCYLFSGQPQISTGKACGWTHPFYVFIDANTTAVKGRLVATWDGATTGSRCLPARGPGSATIEAAGLPGTPTNATLDLTWTE